MTKFKNILELRRGRRQGRTKDIYTFVENPGNQEWIVRPGFWWGLTRMGIKGMMGLGLSIPRDSGEAASVVVGAGKGHLGQTGLLG